MAVTVSTTNKPLIPRAKDYSPSPIGYNRAALYSGKALDFDGVNDVVNVTTNDLDFGANDFSVSAIVRFDGSISEAKIAYLDKGSTLAAWQIRINPTSNRLAFQANTSSGWSEVNFDDAALEIQNDLTHLTFVRVGSSVTLYINGALYGSGTGLAETLDASNGAFAIGNRIGSSEYWNGLITQYKIFSGALTAAQVSDLYLNPEKIVPDGVADSALKLWLPRMEGAGTTAYNGAPDALGSNIVTNGTFDTDSDWTKDTGWTIGNGKAARSGASSNSFISQDFNVVSGTTYILKYDRTYISGSGETNCYSYFVDNVSRSSRGIYSSTIQETVTVVDTFTPTHSGNLAFRLYGIGTFEGSVDNVEIKPITGIGTISGATWTYGIGAPVAQTSVIDWNKIQARTNGGALLNEVLVPQGLTTGRDLLGNLFKSARNPYALNLDGFSWGEVHDNASLDITDAVSLEMWIYWEEQSAEKTILGKWISGDNRAYALIATITTGEIDFRQRISSSTYQLSISTLSSGWNHIVATHDHSANERIGYINGVQVTTSSSQGVSNESDNDVTIGGNSTAQYTNSIALPRIYNRALTATEVARNYNADRSKFGL